MISHFGSTYFYSNNKIPEINNELYNLKAPTTNIVIDIQNINPKLFTPLTNYIINDKDIRLQGLYYLTAIQYMFSTSDYTSYQLYGQLYLSK